MHMLDSFLPILSGIAGTYVLVWLLPTACALGIGLVIVGFMQSKPVLVLGGIAFPIAALILGASLQGFGLASESAPANLGASVVTVAGMLPFSLGVAALIFLMAVLPAIVRVARR
jgi:hypothetical protein